MIDIKDKTALVTGASRGVGQQIALGLAQLGCNLILHGRTKESNAKTVEMLKSYDVKISVVYGELSEEAEVNDLIKQVQELGVSVDILYNNAAVMSPYNTNIWNHTWEDWMWSFKVNVMAMYSLCKAFVPAMIENGFGRVVNTTSGIMHEPELAPYGASKWAVNKLTDDYAARLNDTGVRMNTLDPGWCRTDLGGDQADHAVEEVLPGALAPVLIENNGSNGQFFSAIDHNLDKDLLK